MDTNGSSTGERANERAKGALGGERLMSGSGSRPAGLTTGADRLGKEMMSDV